jgi:hypothetical protein
MHPKHATKERMDCYMCSEFANEEEEMEGEHGSEGKVH